jgi:hypothetical protein
MSEMMKSKCFPHVKIINQFSNVFNVFVYELKKGAKAMQVILCQSSMKTDCFCCKSRRQNMPKLSKTDKEKWL